MTAKDFKAKYDWGIRLFWGITLDTRMCSNCKYGSHSISTSHHHPTLKSADYVSTEINLRCMACSSRFHTPDYCGCAHWEGGNDSRRVQEEPQL